MSRYNDGRGKYVLLTTSTAAIYKYVCVNILSNGLVIIKTVKPSIEKRELV